VRGEDCRLPDRVRSGSIAFVSTVSSTPGAFAASRRSSGPGRARARAAAVTGLCVLVPIYLARYAHSGGAALTGTTPVSWSALLHGGQSANWSYALRHVAGSSWPVAPLVAIAVALAIASAALWGGSARRVIGAGAALAVLAAGGLAAEIAASGAPRTYALTPAAYRSVQMGVVASLLAAELGRPAYVGTIALSGHGARLRCTGYVSTLAGRVISTGGAGSLRATAITRSPYLTGAGDDYLFCFAGGRLARKFAV
jgi:hypothetical protein